MTLYTEPKFDYPKLSRSEQSGKRHYITPSGGRVPSVTTILDKTADKKFLIEWRKRIGQKKAASITEESANIGTAMHTRLENFVKGKPSSDGSNQIHKLSKAMADLIIDNGLSKMSEVWGLEASLFVEGLYCGTTDCVGIYEGEPAIVDFKNSRQIKKREWVEDYFIQTAAYALAHNEMFGTNINKGIILMAGRTSEAGVIDDGNPQFAEYRIEGDEFKAYTDKWLERVARYYEV